MSQPTFFRLAFASFLAASIAGCATPPAALAPSVPTVEAAAVDAAPAEPADIVVAPAASAADQGSAAAAPVDPLRPEVVIDPDDASARTDLWSESAAASRSPT